MRKLVGLVLILALVVLTAAYPVAVYLDSRATEVQPYRPWDQALVDFNKWQFAEGDWEDSVVAIYGAAEGTPLRVLFVDEARLLRPSEDRDLVLLAKQPSEHLLQAQTVWFFAKWTAAGALAVVLLSAAGLFALRRRRPVAS